MKQSLQPILKTLIASNYLAKSPRQLALALGYKGGQLFSKLIKDDRQLQESTLEKNWYALQKVFRVNEYELMCGVKEVIPIFEMMEALVSKELWTKKGRDDEYRLVETLGMGGDDVEQSLAFNRSLGILKTMRKDFPLSYFKALAWFYVVVLKRVNVYAPSGMEDYIKVLDMLSNYLQLSHGTNAFVENLSESLRQIMKRMPFNIHFVCAFGGFMLSSFFSPQIMLQMERIGCIFNLGSWSWWRDAEEVSLSSSSKMYALFESRGNQGEIDSSMYRLTVYEARLREGRVVLETESVQTLVFMPAGEVIGWRFLPQNGLLCFDGIWRYDEGEFFFSEIDSGIHLPERLRRIDMTGATADDQPWQQFILQESEAKLKRMSLHFMLHTIGLEEVMDERVVDIILSRDRMIIETEICSPGSKKKTTYRFKKEDVEHWGKFSSDADVHVLYRYSTIKDEVIREKVFFFTELTFFVKAECAE